MNKQGKNKGRGSSSKASHSVIGTAVHQDMVKHGATSHLEEALCTAVFSTGQKRELATIPGASVLPGRVTHVNLNGAFPIAPGIVEFGHRELEMEAGTTGAMVLTCKPVFGGWDSINVLVSDATWAGSTIPGAPGAGIVALSSAPAGFRVQSDPAAFAFVVRFSLTIENNSQQPLSRKGRLGILQTQHQTPAAATMNSILASEAGKNFSPQILDDGNRIEISWINPGVMTPGDITAGLFSTVTPGGYISILGTGMTTGDILTVKLTTSCFKWGGSYTSRIPMSVTPMLSDAAWNCVHTCFLSVFEMNSARYENENGRAARQIRQSALIHATKTSSGFTLANALALGQKYVLPALKHIMTLL